MDDVKIFVELPQEVEKWLEQNETSLARLLRQQGVEVRESHELNPFWQEDGDATGRDLSLALTVTCGGAVFITALGVMVNNILKTLHKKPISSTISRWTTVRDAKGEVVFGKDGEPLYEFEETPVLLEPRAEDSTVGLQFELKDPQGGNVFQLCFGSSHKELQ